MSKPRTYTGRPVHEPTVATISAREPDGEHFQPWTLFRLTGAGRKGRGAAEQGPQKSEQNYRYFKLAANGRAVAKANYWLTWDVCRKKLIGFRDAKLLAQHRAHLAISVQRTLAMEVA